MEDIPKLCSDKICRICLRESSNMRCLSVAVDGASRTLWDVLSFVSNLTINMSDTLPRQVCNECEGIMFNAYAFKRRCIESETFLNRYAEDETFHGMDLEMLRKTLVKDEIVIESNSIEVDLPSFTSKSSRKSVDISFSEVKKDSEIDEQSILCSTSKSFGLTISKINIPKSDELIKTEDSNDFESQNDFEDGFDIEDDEPIIELKLYACSCGNIYHRKSEYDTHLRENFCNRLKKSKIKTEKKSTQEKKVAKRQFTCPECNLEFNSMKACKLHKRKHNNETELEKYQCTQCMRKFDRKSSFTNHMKNHIDKSNIKFTCETCKREFQHKAHLDNHILNVHTREKGFPCELCNTNFSTQESLELHKESHKVEKKHQCTQCSKSFIMLSTLNDHMRTHTGEKPFLCSICGRGFSQKTNLAQHMRRHQGLKPFKCEDCDRQFVSKGELVAHKRKHSGAHPFVCDECGGGFTTSSSLVKHRRTHTGERPYVCDLCPARFAASGTLKNHRRTHTGEKPFQCSYCDKAFVQRHDLISHIRCHTGERPFVCDCGQAFRKASALKAHVRMHAKEPCGQINALLTGIGEGISANQPR